MCWKRYKNDMRFLYISLKSSFLLYGIYYITLNDYIDSNKNLIKINGCVQLKLGDYVPMILLHSSCVQVKEKFSVISWCIEVVVAKRDQHLPYH